MIEETARVLSSEGSMAVVETHRVSACGQCASKADCGTSFLAGLFANRPVRVAVSNPIGAKPGDYVIVGLSESLFTRASLLLYLLPLGFLILFSIAGQWLAGYLGFAAREPWSVVGGLLGLTSGLWWARVQGRAVESGPAGHAVILRQKTGQRVERGLS